MTDRHSQLTTVPDEVPLAGAVEWLSRQCTAWRLEGFAAVVGGLVIFSPLIDGGTTQLPAFIIRLVLVATTAFWLLKRMKEGELFLPLTRLDVCVLGFVCWAILSFSWAPYKNASLQWVLSILSYVAFFVMVTQGLR